MYTKAALLSLAALPAAYGAVHEKLSSLPRGWTETGHQLNDQQLMKLQVAVNYQNLDSLEDRLMELAHPSSSKYGKWMEKEDVDAVFAPSAEHVQKVKDWVSQAGARNIQYEEGIVSFETSLGEASSMLNTKFAVYTDGKTQKLRTTEYSVPDELQDMVDFVQPTTYFSSMQKHAAIPHQYEASVYEELEKRQSNPAGQLNPSCFTPTNFSISANQTVLFELLSPTCLKELYSVGNYTPDASSGSSIAFGNFLNESASYSDLAQFEALYNIPSKNFTIAALINGGVNNQNHITEMDGEANLDVQNIIGVVGSLPVSAYITGGSPPFIPDLLSPNQSENQNEPYLPYYQYLLSQPNSNLPYVITNSYGDHEDTVPEYYAKRVCNMIGMMGMRGRTILESSGDEGTGAVCRANRGAKQAEFTPQFPGTCPYVTAVGGTQFYNPEAAWNASSGGFSNYFPRPSYQDAAVETYLSKYIAPSVQQYYSGNGYVNFSGRGFPDVSAHSLYPFYLTVINGTNTPNGGTSAASPLTAAIFALVNDALLRAGKPVIGFANPWIYSTSGAGFNDITTGGSVGCTGTDLQNGIVIKGAGVIPYASWNATIGWDPVTGWGTPNFPNLVSLLSERSSSSTTSTVTSSPTAAPTWPGWPSPTWGGWPSPTESEGGWPSPTWGGWEA